MRHVVNTGQPPFSAIGLILMHWDDGKSYYGSGALITPSHVLTCAHNFINQDNQPKAKALAAEFFPAWNANPLPSNGGVAADCALVPAPYPRIYDEWDIAILRLSSQVRVKFPFALTVTQSPKIDGLEVRLTGYPQDDGNNDGLMFDDTDTIDAVDLRTNSLVFTPRHPRREQRVPDLEVGAGPIPRIWGPQLGARPSSPARNADYREGSCVSVNRIEAAVRRQLRPARQARRRQARMSSRDAGIDRRASQDPDRRSTARHLGRFASGGGAIIRRLIQPNVRA